jgi:hypothetical protein
MFTALVDTMSPVVFSTAAVSLRVFFCQKIAGNLGQISRVFAKIGGATVLVAGQTTPLHRNLRT